MKNKKVLFVTQAAVIAAIYVVLTMVFAPLSFGEIQVRFSEALTVLPYFTPAAIPGLAIGCLFGNFFGGGIPVDILFGSLATLLGAVGSFYLRKYKFLVTIPPVLANIVIVPLVLYYGYGINLPIPFMILTVGAGEVISCMVLGYLLLLALNKYRKIIFRDDMVM